MCAGAVRIGGSWENALKRQALPDLLFGETAHFNHGGAKHVPPTGKVTA
jgi:hypothetical protein